MKRKPQPITLALRCSCGASMRGGVSPAVAAMKIRDIFVRCHRGDDHRITDTSALNDQSVMLRQEVVS